jgi:hypothetical protein
MRSPARDELWRELSDLFAVDDGSLPEIRLLDLSIEGVVQVFEELCHRAEPLDSTQTVWHDERDQEVPFAELSDAVELAANGRITTLHVLLSGIRSSGNRLPDLGVSVQPGEVALDYRMGEDWNADVLAAFIELLAELQALDPDVRLAAAHELDLVAEQIQERFQRAVQTYLAATR